MTLPESYLRAIVEGSPDLIVLTDVTGAVVFASPACRAVLGFSPEELLGQRAADLVHPEDLANAVSTRAPLGDDAARTSVVRCRRKDGTYAWVESRV